MEENIEAKLETMNKIKEIGDKYNKRKNWILGISAVIIIGSSWYGFRSLNYVDQIDFMNPLADTRTEFLIVQESYKTLNGERSALKQIKDELKKTKDNFGESKFVSHNTKALEKTLEEEIRYVNDRLSEEDGKLKDLRQNLDKENEWNKVIRKHRKIGTALYFVPLIVPLVAGVLLTLNRLAKEDEIEPYLNKQETTPS